MPDGLERVSSEVVSELLRSWIDVYDKAEAIYDGFPPDTRQWIDEKGHRVDSLIPVVAMMQPEVRLLARTLVEDALSATTSRLSHPRPSLTPAIERVIAQAKSSEGEMGGIDERMERVEAKAARVEAKLDEVLSLLGRGATPELRLVERRADQGGAQPQ